MSLDAVRMLINRRRAQGSTFPPDVVEQVLAAGIEVAREQRSAYRTHGQVQTAFAAMEAKLRELENADV